MARCSSMVYAMAIVFLVVLVASPAQSAGRSLASSTGGANNATEFVVNSTAESLDVDAGVARPSGDGDLVFCVKRKCVYPGRGSSDCYCCSTDRPNKCYDTMGKCSSNCV